MDNLVELSWAQSCYKKKNRWQRLLSIELLFYLFIYFCRDLPVLRAGKPHTYMLLLIHCIYSDTVDIEATDRFMVESL